MPDKAQSVIVLLAHGTPDVLSDMAPYLDRVTGGRPMPPHVVEELQHRYAEIGLRDDPLPGGPPLTKWTLRQGSLLEDLACTTVYVAMRNWHPYIADVVAQMVADGVAHARVLCLAPQYSRTSVGLYKRALTEAVAGRFTVDFIAGWADEPLLASPSPSASGPSGPKPAPSPAPASPSSSPPTPSPAAPSCPAPSATPPAPPPNPVPPSPKTAFKTTAPPKSQTPIPSNVNKPPCASPPPFGPSA